jgi:hypothetical protein
VRLGAAAVAEARSGAVRDKALAAVVEEGGCGCVRCCSDVRSAFFWFAHKMRAVMANAVVGRLYHAWNRWFFGALRVLAAAMKFQHGRVVAQSGGGALFDGAISAEYWSSMCSILLVPSCLSGGIFLSIGSDLSPLPPLCAR